MEINRKHRIFKWTFRAVWAIHCFENWKSVLLGVPRRAHFLPKYCKLSPSLAASYCSTYYIMLNVMLYISRLAGLPFLKCLLAPVVKAVVHFPGCAPQKSLCGQMPQGTGVQLRRFRRTERCTENNVLKLLQLLVILMEHIMSCNVYLAIYHGQQKISQHYLAYPLLDLKETFQRVLWMSTSPSGHQPWRAFSAYLCKTVSFFSFFPANCDKLW